MSVLNMTCETCGNEIPIGTGTPHENEGAEWFLCADCQEHDETCVCEGCRPDQYDDGYDGED